MSIPRVSQPAMGSVVVETTDGKLAGQVEDGICVFKGVAYADDTGGKNRFLPPKPVQKWAGVQEAREWGNSAPQPPQGVFEQPFYAWAAATQALDEDCLRLNVFTPALDQAKRPVMIWLHGGGWMRFAGSSPGYRGGNLAKAQDVVVVTLNHRLSVFGYIQLEASDERFADSGSTGLLDIVMALRWVRDNIAQFGGDPRNVTIFGQSGGAAKTTALLAMPAAKELFHKAIVQSTSGGMHLTEPEEAARHAHSLAKALGLAKPDGRELQKLPMEALISALGLTSGPFRPIVDGRNFMAHPFFPDAPAISVDIPVMAGCTNTETTFNLRVDPRNFSLEIPDVRRRLMRFLQLDDIAIDHLIEQYREQDPGQSPSDLLIAVTTDQLFKRNTLAVAELQSKVGNAPVYTYNFAHETPVEGGRLRSPHTSEIPFIFGTTAAAEACVGSAPGNEHMTRVMMSSWAAFARYGNPGNPLVPRWDRYDANERWTMVLKEESELVSNPGGTARASLDGLPHYQYSNSRETFIKD